MLLMNRSVLGHSWTVAKPRHAGAVYKRLARTVALVALPNRSNTVGVLSLF